MIKHKYPKPFKSIRGDIKSWKQTELQWNEIIKAMNYVKRQKNKNTTDTRESSWIQNCEIMKRHIQIKN